MELEIVITSIYSLLLIRKSVLSVAMIPRLSYHKTINWKKDLQQQRINYPL